MVGEVVVMVVMMVAEVVVMVVKVVVMVMVGGGGGSELQSEKERSYSKRWKTEGSGEEARSWSHLPPLPSFHEMGSSVQEDSTALD